MATISPPPRRPPGEGRAPTYAHAVEAFLVAHDRTGAWSAGTAVKYRQSLTILGTRLAEGPIGASVAALDTPHGAADLAVAFTAAFATLAPATRARHLAALRSALGWWRARGWLVTDPTAGWARPKIARDHSRALTPEQIATLWRLDVGLREKTLWRLLYETAARATEILTLDITDLDRPGKRARVISKGGDIDWVYYQTGTALLLPRLLTGRTRGPVFLAERAPTRATPTLDLCPDTAGPDCPTAARPNCSNTPPHPSRPPPDSRQGGPCTNYAIPRLPTMPRAAPTPRCCSLGPDTPPCAPSSATPDPAPKPSPATPRPPTPPPDDAAARDSPSGRVNRPAPLASPNLSRSPTTAKRCRRPNGRRGGHDISSAVQSPATGGRTVCQ